MKNISRSRKVSVIIPCFNHGKYLKDAVSSVKEQVFTDYELLVVNDGSDDPYTLKVLGQLKDEGIQVIYKDNGGVSSARNRGIAQSSGEYIVNLDADDMYDKTFIEKGSAILDQDDKIGIVASHTRYFGLQDGYIRKPTSRNVIDLLMDNDMDGSMMFRYRCWEDAGGYDEAMESHEDWDFLLRVTEKGWLIDIIPEPLLYYRVTDNSKYEKNKHKRPEYVRRMVQTKRSLFQQNIDQCIYEREKKIVMLESKIEQIKNENKNSWENRIGRIILYPVKKLRSFVQSIARL